MENHEQFNLKFITSDIEALLAQIKYKLTVIERMVEESELRNKDDNKEPTTEYETTIINKPASEIVDILYQVQHKEITVRQAYLKLTESNSDECKHESFTDKIDSWDDGGVSTGLNYDE